MPALNWGLIQDGGVFESLMHAILYAEDPGTILFGRPGKDAGQDARSADGTVVYQAKYRQNLDMDGAVALALKELKTIKDYRQPTHANNKHWQSTQYWTLVANFSINPNDHAKWQSKVVPAFQHEGLVADYWHIDVIESKLTQHLEIRDVFFCGENRALVGLKEAHDLLSAECVGNISLDVPMVGRDDELDRIRAFASSDDKRVLPVIGPGGIGKSRLLYEGLASLAQDGWRVLWGLPGTMARSSQWFRLLNGAQKTCVALDDPDDPGFLRAVIEQLSAVERRHWCIIIACRTEKAEALRQFRTNRNVNEILNLAPLNEAESQALVNACLSGEVSPPWLHSVYGFTHGFPGWLCLIAGLAKREALSELPPSADDVAAVYVESCLEALGETRRDSARTLLRWLALWGTLRLEAGNTEQVEFRFLEAQGLPYSAARDLLKDLVRIGIARNWGVGKRIYAIEPMIVRQHILSKWLLSDNAGTYEVSEGGATLISQLVEGKVPAIDSALGTLSRLTLSRLTEPEAMLFLEPVFSAMTTIVREGNVRDQYRVAELVEKTGAADPDSALDVLVVIRQNAKESMDVEVPLWGPKSFTHNALVASLPWTLFQSAEHVSDPIVARRYLNEFRQLIALEDAGKLCAGSGKGPRELLKRILCRSKNSEAYAQTAHDLAIEQLTSSTDWPFVSLLAESLLNPIRESMDWVANWTITISRRAILPESLEWKLAANLRDKAFDALQTDPQMAYRAPLWHVLAESHHSFHRAVLHDNVREKAIAPYRAVLVSDLTTCAAILRSPPVVLTIEEATYAREMWSWYLRYGHDDDPVDLARQCEQIYNSLSTWRLHEFFRFETDEILAPETARIAEMLRDASGPEVFNEFFDETKRYLNAVRQGHQDGADNWRISTLADACVDLFLPGLSPPANALTAFVVAVLGKPEADNPLAWTFVVRVCQQHLLGIKTAGDVAVKDGLACLLGTAAAKDRLLWWLYSNVHPTSTGTLTSDELDCILTHEANFSDREWFVLLGVFSAVDAGGRQTRLRDRLESMRDDPVEASQCMACFIRSVHLTALRYNWSPTQIPAPWIIDMITEFRLDGVLLGMHELEWLRDQADFRLNMVQLAALIRTRIDLEHTPKPSSRFEIMPHNFEVSAWVTFDAKDQAQVIAIHNLCQMTLDRSFIAMYWMPKYIAQIDSSGQHVKTFVEHYLSENTGIDGDVLARLGYLASSYNDDSDAWASIAHLLCEKAKTMQRDKRERVYFGLARKETGVISSMPGEVPQYYVTTRDIAIRLRDSEPVESPLRGYREWALRRAEEDLRRAEQSAEEDANG